MKISYLFAQMIKPEKFVERLSFGNGVFHYKNDQVFFFFFFRFILYFDVRLMYFGSAKYAEI